MSAKNDNLFPDHNYDLCVKTATDLTQTYIQVNPGLNADSVIEFHRKITDYLFEQFLKSKGELKS